MRALKEVLIRAQEGVPLFYGEKSIDGRSIALRFYQSLEENQWPKSRISWHLRKFRGQIKTGPGMLILPVGFTE